MRRLDRDGDISLIFMLLRDRLFDGEILALHIEFKIIYSAYITLPLDNKYKMQDNNSKLTCKKESVEMKKKSNLDKAFICMTDMR